MVIAGALLFYSYKKYPYINHKIQETVAAKTNGLYKISYDSIYVDELAGTIVLSNLTIVADTAKQMHLLQQHDTSAAGMMVSAVIPQLEVIHFKTARALLSQQLVCEKIVIKEPAVVLHVYPGVKAYKNNKQPQEELYRQLLGNMKLLQAGEVSVVNSKVLAVNELAKQKIFQSVNTSVLLSDVRIDSSYYHDTRRTLFCKRIQLSSDKNTFGETGIGTIAYGLAFDTKEEAFHLRSFEFVKRDKGSVVRTVAESIDITGLQWKGPAEYSDLVIDKVAVKKLSVENTQANEDADNNKGASKRLLSGWIKSFRMNRLDVSSVNYASRKAGDPAATVVNNSSFSMRNFYVDSTIDMDKSLWACAKELDLQNKLVEITTKDKMYKFRIGGIRLNTQSRKLSIAEVKVIPRYDEATFAARAKIQTDRYEVSASNLMASGVDVDELVKGGFYIQTVTCGRTLMKVYHDMHYPPDTSSKIGKYPHQLLMQLNVPVKIHSFVADNFELHYRENNALSDSIGVARFVKSRIEISNIKNVDIGRYDSTTAIFSTSLLGQLPLTGKFTFYLDDWKQGRYSATATINKTFEAAILNSINIPMGMARIDKGTIHYLSCNVSADNYSMRGNFYALYNDLKLSLLEKKKEGINKKTITSFVGNLLVRNSNKPGKQMRIGKINEQRKPSKTFFNFTWKSVFAGARSVLGVKF